MANRIRSVARWSTDPEKADKEQSGDLKRSRPGIGASSASSTRTRELIWLDDVRRGCSIKEIAGREGLGCRRIQHGVSRARKRVSSSHASGSHPSGRLHVRNEKFTAATGKAVRRDSSHPPRLVPLFPIGEFTPRSACPHHGPLRAGSVLCCMVCSQSGVDDHPALKRDPRTDPRPERGSAPLVRSISVRETRKQRRQRLNSARQAGPNMSLAPTTDECWPRS